MKMTRKNVSVEFASYFLKKKKKKILTNKRMLCKTAAPN